MPPTATNVRKFFTKAADKKSATCNLCSTTLKLQGGTSNLNNHLKFKHPSDNKNTQTKETLKQVPLTSFVISLRKFGDSEQEKIAQAIAGMIVSDYLPPSIVESKGFRNLMEIVAPDYKVPCRKTIYSRIVRRYDGEKDALTSTLGSIGTVSLTTDTWTSNSTESYITITEHHIDNERKMRSNVLLTRAMPESHTGENLTSLPTLATWSVPTTCAKTGRTTGVSATLCSSA